MAKWDLSKLGTSQEVDYVNSPPHYNSTIECIDAMEAMTEGAAVNTHAAYCWQSAFKYLWRWPYKKKPVEDLRKCIWYLERLIDILENPDVDSNNIDVPFRHHNL
jgi:hypothetical protein